MRIFASLLVLFIWLTVNVEGQTVQRVYGSDCVNFENTFFFSGMCQSLEWVPSQGGTIVSGQGTNTVTVKWTTAQFNAHVYVRFYGCGGSTSDGTAYSSYFNVVNSLTPSVTITSNVNNVCPGTPITFTASPQNAGSSPTYSWRLNGQGGTVTSSNQFTRSDLSNNDVVDVLMYVSPNGCYSASSKLSENSITVSTVQQIPATVSVVGPQTICSGQTSGASFYAEFDPPLSNRTIQWFRNGAAVIDNAPAAPDFVYAPQTALNDGDRIMCKVTSSLCLVDNLLESADYIVSLTPSQSPNSNMNITLSEYRLCEGSSVTFDVSSPYITNASTYSWRLNGTQFSTAENPSLPISFYDILGHSFKPGDVVTVLVSNLSGTCLQANSATASTENVSFQFYHLPEANIVPSGVLKIGQDAQTNITAPSNVFFSYQWYHNDTPMPSPAGSSNPLTVSQPGTYKVEISDSNSGCKKLSPTLSLSKNVKPVVSAGQDMSVFLPLEEVTLHGSASDPDGHIQSYSWSRVSGPLVTMENTQTPSLTIKGLQIGIYKFNFTATDDFGESSLATVTLEVRFPPNNYNWTRETVVNVPGQKTSQQVETLPVGDRNQTWTYYDGIGRPIQVVNQQASPSWKDIVIAKAYDAHGREPRSFLPYADLVDNNGWYKTNALFDPDSDEDDDNLRYHLGEQFKFYQRGNRVAEDQFPYGETRFESSQLSRVIEQGAPGAAWQPDATDSYNSTDRTVKFRYESNTDEEVVLWTYEYPTASNPSGAVTSMENNTRRYYARNQLQKKFLKDENHHEVIEYTDSEGKVILKRVQAPGNSWAETYYIYDDFGNLVVVLPPEAVKALIEQ